MHGLFGIHHNNNGWALLAQIKNTIFHGQDFVLIAFFQFFSLNSLCLVSESIEKYSQTINSYFDCKIVAVYLLFDDNLWTEFSETDGSGKTFQKILRI